MFSSLAHDQFTHTPPTVPPSPAHSSLTGGLSLKGGRSTHACFCMCSARSDMILSCCCPARCGAAGRLVSTAVFQTQSRDGIGRSDDALPLCAGFSLPRPAHRHRRVRSSDAREHAGTGAGTRYGSGTHPLTTGQLARVL